MFIDKDEAIEKGARELWIADGGGPDYWDQEHTDGWRPYMLKQKTIYRAKVKNILIAIGYIKGKRKKVEAKCSG